MADLDSSEVGKTIPCFNLPGEIEEPIEKAKAIVDLMAAAAKDGELDHSAEIQWAQMIVWDLLNDAMAVVKRYVEQEKAKH